MTRSQKLINAIMSDITLIHNQLLIIFIYTECHIEILMLNFNEINIVPRRHDWLQLSRLRLLVKTTS